MRLLTLLFLIILTSCSSTKEVRKDYQANAYEPRTKFTLNVSEISFQNDYSPQIEYPHIEHLLPQQIPFIVKDWFKKHIDTTNTGSLKVKVIIKNASATEYDYQNIENPTPNFTKDDILYELKLAVRIEVYDEKNPSLILNEINSEIEKTGTIRKKSSHHLHTDLFNKLLDEIAKDFNNQMMEAIPNYFAKNIASVSEF